MLLQLVDKLSSRDGLELEHTQVIYAVGCWNLGILCDE